MSEEYIEDFEEKLDNPLVVHKKSDASYIDSVTTVEMNETHEVEEGPTLQRHRFKKDPNKKSNGRFVVPIVLVFLVAIFCALYFTGNLKFGKEETTTAKTISTTQTTTSIEEAYSGTIVIKDTYIFIDGIEVNGVEGLVKELKYVDPSQTAYKIILENPNSDFYNFEVLDTLTRLGFYGKKTVVEHAAKTGLISEAETTTITTSTTQSSTNQQETE